MEAKILEELQAAAAKFEQELMEKADQIETLDEETCQVLIGLRDVISALRYADELLTSKIGRLMKTPITTDGLTLEAKWSRPTAKWDSERLKSVVSEKIVAQSIDPDTGTVAEPPWVLVTKILDYAGISYWRTGKLKELEIDPNDYRETGQSKVRVEIHGRK